MSSEDSIRESLSIFLSPPTTDELHAVGGKRRILDRLGRRIDDEPMGRSAEFSTLPDDFGRLSPSARIVYFFRNALLGLLLGLALTLQGLLVWALLHDDLRVEFIEILPWLLLTIFALAFDLVGLIGKIRALRWQETERSIEAEVFPRLMSRLGVALGGKAIVVGDRCLFVCRPGWPRQRTRVEVERLEGRLRYRSFNDPSGVGLIWSSGRNEENRRMLEDLVESWPSARVYDGRG